MRALPDHPLTHRLVRGRAWIVLIGCLLLGIVAAQVALLKLNAGIGRAVQQSANLQRRNGELRAQVSRLSAEERIQSQGIRLGLAMPDAGHVTYLTLRGTGSGRAAARALRAGRLGRATSQTLATSQQGNLSQPSDPSQQYAASQPADGSAAAGQAPAGSADAQQAAPASADAGTATPATDPSAADPSTAGAASSPPGQ